MDQRWLFWGRRHPDPEVRLRSNAILRRLNPCSTCKGTGQLEELGRVAVLGLPGHRHGVAVVDVGLTRSNSAN